MPARNQKLPDFEVMKLRDDERLVLVAREPLQEEHVALLREHFDRAGLSRQAVLLDSNFEVRIEPEHRGRAVK